MHHALEIHEILSNIFHNFSPPTFARSYGSSRRKVTSVLAALAGTCRTFKEPALDVLWRDFNDLCPLAQCLPDASQRLSSDMTYSFTRPLTQIEWDILQSYTRRIRSIQEFNLGLDWESVAAFLNPPTTEPLFPGLHTLNCRYTANTTPWLRLPLPSLVNLHVDFEKSKNSFQGSLESFPRFSPNIRRLCIRVDHLKRFIKIEPNYICRWQGLSSVTCLGVALDMDDLSHLSRIPALTELQFAMSAVLPNSDLPLTFSTLRSLTINSRPLEPISRLLSQIRLPALTWFRAHVDNCPSNGDLTSFFAAISTSSTGHTIEVLHLTQSYLGFRDDFQSAEAPLGFEDLRPCMEFNNLHSFHLDVLCNVGLTDRGLLTLASAWPKLDSLLVNEQWGWNTRDGITPGGLVQLLQTCRLLRKIDLRLDTLGYTQVLPSHVPNVGLTLSPILSFNVLDATIEAESVAAISSFLCGIATCTSVFDVRSWTSARILAYEYRERWGDVCCKVNNVRDLCSGSGD